MESDCGYGAGERRHPIRNDKSISDLNSTRNTATEVARSFAEIEEIRSEQQDEESSISLGNQLEHSFNESLNSTPQSLLEDVRVNDTLVECRNLEKGLISSPRNTEVIEGVRDLREKTITESPIKRPQRSRRLSKYLADYYL